MPSSGMTIGGSFSYPTVPPTPTGLTATAISSSQINLAWTADNNPIGHGLKDYGIYRFGSLVGYSVSNAYSDLGLTASTLYQYTITARGLNLVESAQSAPASATTQSSGVGATFYPAAGVTISPSANMVDGNSYLLTVAAGGLGARANALPLYYWPMTLATGLTTHPTLSRNQRTLTDNGNGTAVTTTNPYPNAGASCQYLITTTSGSTSTAFGNSPHVPVPGGTGYQMYVMAKHYWGFAAAPSNDKFLRGWSSLGGVGNTPDIYWAYGAGGNYILATENNDNAVNRPLGSHFLGLPLTTQAWNSREMWWQENTLNVSDGICNFALNGVFGYVPQTRYGVCFANNSSGANPTGAGPITNWYFDQYSSFNGPNGTTDLSYFGPIYVDDSYLQLILTDEGSTYQTAVAATGTPHNREIQIQTNRTDTQIQFTYRQGMFSTMTNQNFIATTGYMTGMNLGSFQASGSTFDYYISSTGSDSNTGTLASPWAITAINTQRSIYAGKRVGIIGNTALSPTVYGISSLMTTDAQNAARNPALNINGGPDSSHLTYIAACNNAGVYTPRCVKIVANDNGTLGGQVTSTNAMIGCNNTVTNRGNWTIDGLVISGFSLWAIHVGNSPSGGVNITNWTIQNCEITGGSTATATNASGVNCGPLIIYTANNGTVTNNWFHDNVSGGVNDAAHFSCVYQWGELGPAGGTFNIVYSFNTLKNTGGIHAKESNQQGNSLFNNYIEWTTGGTGQNSSCIQGFDGAPTSGLTQTTTIHHNILVAAGQGINVESELGNGGISTPFTVYNNTIVSTASLQQYFRYFEAPTATALLSFYNNLYFDNGHVPLTNYGYMIANVDAFAICDYNCYGGGTGSQWNTVAAGAHSSAGVVNRTFANWKTVINGGADAHSLNTVATLTNNGTYANQYQVTTGAAFGTGKVGGTSGGANCNIGAWDGTVTQIGASWVS